MRFDRIQDKGTDRDREAYSGFDGTDLGDYLRGPRRRSSVLVTGVASDYCVRATALDAVREGFRTTVLTDAVAAVDVAAGRRRAGAAEVAAPAARLDKVALLRDEAALAPMLEAQGGAAARGDARRRAGQGACIGLSGGIDSAVAMALAARALGPEHVMAVRLPSRHTEQVHVDDAAASAPAAGLPEENLLTVSIDPLIDGACRGRAPDAAGSRPSGRGTPARGRA